MFRGMKLRQIVLDALSIALRGLSGYCQAQSPPPSTLVAGYGGLRDEQIPEAAARLKRAWQ